MVDHVWLMSLSTPGLATDGFIDLSPIFAYTFLPRFNTTCSSPDTPTRVPLEMFCSVAYTASLKVLPPSNWATVHQVSLANHAKYALPAASLPRPEESLTPWNLSLVDDTTWTQAPQHSPSQVRCTRTHVILTGTDSCPS